MHRIEIDYAHELDKKDPLRPFRDRFFIEEPELIYLDGNSLGRLPCDALTRGQELLTHQWGKRLIRGWNESWLQLSEQIGGKIARLLGADANEVIAADSTSVNLFKLAVAALRARPGRHKIVTDDLNFPSDLYVLESVLRMAGHRGGMKIVSSTDGITIAPEALAEAIDQDTALVSLSHTTFKNGFVHDMPAVTELAHQAGALILWDVSHSVGAMPLSLTAHDVDLAVGSTYKYLNGGPGAPAFLYIRRDLQEQLENPIAGWFGQRDPFAFATTYEPAPGLRRFLTGTPPVLSLALIEVGVDLLLEAGLKEVRAKSVAQTQYLIDLWEIALAPHGFKLNSPREGYRRGSHVSLSHSEALRIDRALIDRMGVIPDFRHPDNIRLGVCPLYTTFADLHKAVMALRQVVADRLYEKYPTERAGVT